MNKINSITDMQENLEEFEKRLLKEFSNVEIFTYVMTYCERCRLNLMFNPLSPWNKEHIKISNKMIEAYDNLILNLKENFNIKLTEKETQIYSKAQETKA